jgi:magnesium-transporting ATPase (P-type)
VRCRCNHTWPDNAIAGCVAVTALVCAVLSFVQEYRADNALNASKKMPAPTIAEQAS